MYFLKNKKMSYNKQSVLKGAAILFAWAIWLFALYLSWATDIKIWWVWVMILISVVPYRIYLKYFAHSRCRVGQDPPADL
jgi:hypothetical protein